MLSTTGVGSHGKPHGIEDNLTRLSQNKKRLFKNYLSAEGVTITLSGLKPKSCVLIKKAKYLKPELIENTP